MPRPEDLELSSFQEEDSDSFVYVSIEGDQAIAATPRPLLPRTPDGFSPRLVQGYRPDERRVESLKWLTFFLGLTIVFSAAPALPHVNLFTAPGWARAALLLAVLQGCYLAWMLSAPDWSTIRTVTIVFGVAGVIYAAALALILVAPADRPLPLGLEEVRSRAMQWCGCVLTLMLFGAYLCARASSEWRLAAFRDGAARIARARR